MPSLQRMSKVNGDKYETGETREPSETTEKGRFQQSGEKKTVAKLVFKMNFWK